MKPHFKVILAGGIAALIATIATLIYIVQPTGFKGFYDNSPDSYLGSAAAEDMQLAWHVRNGDNAIYAYGFGSKITSTTNWPKIANYIKKARRKGIKTFGFIYSSTSNIGALDAYQKAQPNDSSRFNAVISEIEPYNTGDYAGFYTTIRAYSEWAKKQTPRVERDVYMGWPTAACWDSIITNTDRTFLHAYLQPSLMTGAGIWGYTKSRQRTIAGIVKTKYASNLTYKYNIVILFSCEPTFSYTYFQSNSWDKPLSDFTSYWNSNADSVCRARLRIGGRQIFKSTDGRKARP